MLINKDVITNQILRNTFGILFWKDLNHTFQGANIGFAKLAGYSEPEQIIGKTDYDLFATNLADKYRADDQQVFTGKTFETIEHNLRNEHTQQKIVYVKKHPLRNDMNDIIGVVGYGKILCDTLIEPTDVSAVVNQQIDRIIIDTKLIGEHYFDLSAAEINTLFMLIHGFSASTTGKLLSKSERTIEQHIVSIKGKMTVKNKQEMINKAITSGFIQIIPKALHDQFIQD